MRNHRTQKTQEVAAIVPADAKDSYEASSLNALRHGVLSRHSVLPWEDRREYDALMSALEEEYKPKGMTQAYLVEELAGILWRKRRLRLAELATYHREIKPDTTYNYMAPAALACISTDADMHKFDLKKALERTEEENRRELKDIAKYREPAIKALAMLDDGDAYEKALALLAEGTREWWEQEALGEAAFKGGFAYQATAEHLQHFLRFDALPQYNQEYEDVRHRARVKQQAEGEAFIPRDKLEKLARYEVHLDRKFERILSMIIKLQEMMSLSEDSGH